jgi:hypothetical protein
MTIISSDEKMGGFTYLAVGVDVSRKVGTQAESTPEA